MKPKGTILIVDDNEAMLTSLKILLHDVFATVCTTPHPHTIPSMLRAERPDVVLLDMNFGRGVNNGNEGLFWLQEIQRLQPGVSVVLFTAYADIELAVNGLKLGAADFVVKPFDNERIIEVLVNQRDRKDKKKTARRQSQQPMFWGESEAMKLVREKVERAAPTDANILITGENGTGKEVLAREIHRLSFRAAGPMVAVDMGTIPASLFESELFGHVKGAFTDAHADKPGKFELASGGTLFLDEIGNLSYALQAKMLAALQNRTVTRVGGRSEISFDVRLITATNRNVETMVAEQSFREDLFYRINTITLHLPPLRERAADIVPLAEMFLKRYALAYGRPVPRLSPDAVQKLTAYPWPGNIRQLQHTMERTLILTDGDQISAAHLELPAVAVAAAPSAELVTLEAVERDTIERAMTECGGNMSAVAQRLGITRQTLYNKLKKYGI